MPQSLAREKRNRETRVRGILARGAVERVRPNGILSGVLGVQNTRRFFTTEYYIPTTPLRYPNDKGYADYT